MRALVAAAALVAAVPCSAQAAPMVADASFESPALPAGGYEYGVQNGAQRSSTGVNAEAAGVIFSSGAGVQSNGGAWGFAPAPAGRQTAFLQSYDNQVPGRITQAVSGLTPGQFYRIRFYAANRPGFGLDPVTVSVAGVELGTFQPASARWEAFNTSAFEAESATAVIVFSVPMGAGDADIGLDEVSVAPAAP